MVQTKIFGKRYLDDSKPGIETQMNNWFSENHILKKDVITVLWDHSGEGLGTCTNVMVVYDKVERRDTSGDKVAKDNV